MPRPKGTVGLLSSLIGLNRNRIYRVTAKYGVSRLLLDRVYLLLSELKAQSPIILPHQVIEYLVGTHDREAQLALARYAEAWHVDWERSKYNMEKAILKQWTWGRVIVVTAFYLEEVDRSEHTDG